MRGAGAFCGRLRRNSSRRVSTHGTRPHFRGLLTDRAPAGSPEDWTADGMSCPLRREHLIIKAFCVLLLHLSVPGSSTMRTNVCPRATELSRGASVTHWTCLHGRGMRAMACGTRKGVHFLHPGQDPLTTVYATAVGGYRHVVCGRPTRVAQPLRQLVEAEDWPVLQRCLRQPFFHVIKCTGCPCGGTA
jgi:hypothetical protein